MQRACGDHIRNLVGRNRPAEQIPLDVGEARFDQPGQAADEVFLDAEGRDPDIMRNFQLLGQVPVLDVKLDQGFRMFGDEGDGPPHHGEPGGPGAAVAVS